MSPSWHFIWYTEKRYGENDFLGTLIIVQLVWVVPLSIIFELWYLHKSCALRHNLVTVVYIWHLEGSGALGHVTWHVDCHMNLYLGIMRHRFVQITVLTILVMLCAHYFFNCYFCSQLSWIRCDIAEMDIIMSTGVRSLTKQLLHKKHSFFIRKSR